MEEVYKFDVPYDKVSELKDVQSLISLSQQNSIFRDEKRVSSNQLDLLRQSTWEYFSTRMRKRQGTWLEPSSRQQEQRVEELRYMLSDARTKLEVSQEGVKRRDQQNAHIRGSLLKDVVNLRNAVLPL